MNQHIKFWVIPLVISLVLPGRLMAVPFGIYEPRSLAMGGAGVAAATSVNAVFYNPAILATYSEYKEKAKNEALSFPVLSIRASRAVETLAAQRDINYEAEITTSFATFNADPTEQNAQAAFNSVSSLYNTLGQLANNVFLLDASASFVIGVPTKYQGGAFFFTQRGVGDGQFSITAEDIALMNDYQEALQYIISSGSRGASHPELFDGNGDLINPSASITSEVNARAAVISELGIGLSKQIMINGSGVYVGLTPKMVQVTTYDYQQSINSSRQNKDGLKDDDWQLNFDFGVLKEITPQWRIGLVVKNIIERSYPTGTGQQVTIKPQWRLGVVRNTPLIAYTVDLDLQKNDGVYPGNSAQFLLTGIEIKQGRLRYRLGYRDTLAYSGPKQDGIFSAGFGLNMKTIYLDLAYSENHQQRAASLMFGFHF